MPAVSYSSSDDEDSFYDADNYDSDTNHNQISHVKVVASSSIQPDPLQKSTTTTTTTTVSNLITFDQQVTEIQEVTVVSNAQNFNVDQSHPQRYYVIDTIFIYSFLLL